MGTHLTRFIGTSPQTIFFYYPGTGTSRFANLEITNLNVSVVTLASSAYVANNLGQFGKLTIPSGQTLTIVGALTLNSGSTTTLISGGTLIKGTCVAAGGTATGFSCP